MARRAPKVKDLGFSLRQFRPVVCGLQAAYDGGNGNGRFAMKAHDAGESWAFGFKRHIRSSQGYDSGLRGRPILLQRSSMVQSHNRLSCGNRCVDPRIAALFAQSTEYNHLSERYLWFTLTICTFPNWAATTWPALTELRDLQAPALPQSQNLPNPARHFS